MKSKVFISIVIGVCRALISSAQDSIPTVKILDQDLLSFQEETSFYIGDFSTTNDVFLNHVTFNYRSVFFRLRGLHAQHNTFLINGLKQQSLYNNQPLWYNWSGVDGIYTNQQIVAPLQNHKYAVGGVLTTTNFNLNALDKSKGGRLH